MNLYHMTHVFDLELPQLPLPWLVGAAKALAE